MEDTYKGQVDNPLTLNRYTYTGNNSLKYVDPTGHDFVDILQGFGEALQASVTFGLSDLWADGPREGQEEDYYLGQDIGFNTVGVYAAYAAAASATAGTSGLAACTTGAGCAVGGPIAVAGYGTAVLASGVSAYAFYRANGARENYEKFAQQARSGLRGKIKDEGLPTDGPLRYIPDKKKGVYFDKNKNGYVDRFGNIWREGPYHGDPKFKDTFKFEWDVELSPQGVKVWGDLRNPGKNYVNVRPDGYLSH